ncbi:hypothetical protein FIV42_14120 [Persicimonas caeni]|uniref:Uncharacterized protein n=1 Tax=Persicimonas caeni TaxID=2292766 RepID=A0A4Y6PV15_PERCE|nr:hypothetical protein [Persicimonas caeni]QDG51837.1 hypothetical protein FIV42_14120 [Persicimonas caeni]QED33058.1 hypothetical protein FRD00_14115 [Persicimonas caeni]
MYDTDQGQVFDWVSNPVNGGDNGNFYRYTDAHNDVGEQATDDGLHAPVGSSGLYSDISHISFCFDLELDVEKTATAKFTRTYDRDITKRADETDWALFKGDTATRSRSAKKARPTRAFRSTARSPSPTPTPTSTPI